MSQKLEFIAIEHCSETSICLTRSLVTLRCHSNCERCRFLDYGLYSGVNLWSNVSSIISTNSLDYTQKTVTYIDVFQRIQKATNILRTNYQNILFHDTIIFYTLNTIHISTESIVACTLGCIHRTSFHPLANIDTTIGITFSCHLSMFRQLSLIDV